MRRLAVLWSTGPTCSARIICLTFAVDFPEMLKFLSPSRYRPQRRISRESRVARRIRCRRQPSARPDCDVCGRRRFPHLAGRHRAPISLCGRNAVQIHDRSRPVDLTSLKTHLFPFGEVRANELALRFFVPPYEMTIFHDGRAIVKGTSDPGIARKLYAQYVGT